jgi:hypothetical protein
MVALAGNLSMVVLAGNLCMVNYVVYLRFWPTLHPSNGATHLHNFVVQSVGLRLVVEEGGHEFKPLSTLEVAGVFGCSKRGMSLMSKYIQMMSRIEMTG